MRRVGTIPHGTVTWTGATAFPETNPEVWVQLGVEPRNTHTAILETVQELKEEMARQLENREKKNRSTKQNTKHHMSY